MSSLDPKTKELFQRLDKLQINIPTAPDETAVAVEMILLRAREGKAVSAIARAIYLLALCALQKDEYEKAIGILDQASVYNKQEHDTEVRMQIWAYRGAFLQQMGLFDESLQSMWQSLELARKIDNKAGEFLALHNISYLHSEIGHYQEALDLQIEAMKVARDIKEDRFIIPSHTGIIGNLYLMGEYKQVIELSHSALKDISATENSSFYCTVMHDLSLAYLHEGLPNKALELIEHAKEVARDLDNLHAIAEVDQALGQVIFARGDIEKGLEYVLSSIEQAKKLSYRILIDMGHKQAAKMYEELQDYKNALFHAQSYYESERRLISKKENVRAKYLTSIMRLDISQREAEIERLKNVELVNTNKTLQITQLALLHQATHDPLTGVLNLSAFLDKVSQSLQRLQDSQNSLGLQNLEKSIESEYPNKNANKNINKHVGLIFIDIDHFKSINDLYGHRMGDSILIEICNRLNNLVDPEHEVVARVGGDEFVVLCDNIAAPEEVHKKSQEFLEAIRKPFYIVGQQLDVTASVGCAIAPEDGDEASRLRQNADLAMYSVKSSNRNRAVRFNAEMAEEQLGRQKMERELRGVAKRGELCLYYQGRFSLHNLSLVGFEALLRWQHPEHGLIPPNQFIPLAEETGLILPIGAWVINEACRQAKEWRFAEKGLTMSLNVSPLQFEQDGFLETIKDAIYCHDLPDNVLIVEITESLILRNLERAKIYITELQKMGIKVALDDFGKGYSSLGVIHTLPINHLKIDRSFMRDLQNKSDQRTAKKSRILLETMIHLAQKLNMQVTAEGVENSKQLEVLMSLRCDYVQGFYCARPLPAKEALLILPEQWKSTNWEDKTDL